MKGGLGGDLCDKFFLMRVVLKKGYKSVDMAVIEYIICRPLVMRLSVAGAL